MLTLTQKRELQKQFSDKVLFDEPMSLHTSIRIGGSADLFFSPDNIADLEWMLCWCRQNQIPAMVLGKGSNTLVRDGGVRGVVISLARGFSHFALDRTNGHFVWVRAGAGTPTQQLVKWGIAQGFGGLERLAGVPGTVGGNVVMNAGTFHGEIKELIETIDVFDPSASGGAGRVRQLSKEKIQFEYRKTHLPPKAIVLETTLKLEKGSPEELEKKMKDLFEKRSEAQPVTVPNLGSIFKNPPKHKAKTLIEEAGLSGVRVGGARVSEKHANWIVNENNATAKDVLVLIGLIKDRVNDAAGILLETEIKVIGNDKV